MASFDSNIYAINIETGKEFWRFKTGKYGNSGAPFFHEGRIYSGCRDGTVYCLDTNGKEIWRFETGSIVVQVAVRNQKIYFGNEEGDFYCLDLKGKEIWRIRTSGGNYTEPLYVDGRIYFGSMDCRLYCVDSESGEEIWRFETSTLVKSDIGKPYDMFEVVIKKERTEEEIEEEEKYEVDFSKGLRDEYDSKNEYQVKIEYQQKMKY